MRFRSSPSAPAGPAIPIFRIAGISIASQLWDNALDMWSRLSQTSARQGRWLLKRILPGFSSPFLWSPLGRQLLAAILAVSTLLACVTTSIQLLWEYRTDVGDIDSTFQQIQQAYSRTLATAIWNFDYETIRTTLDGIASLSTIESAAIHTNEDRDFFSGARREDHQLIKVESRLALVHNGETRPMGTLVLAASRTQLFHRLMSKALLILLVQTLKTFLVSLAVLTVVDFLLNRHLRALAADVGRLDPHRSTAPLKLARRKREDELEALVQAFNDMQERLQASLTKRRELDEQLNQARRMEALGRLAGGVAHDFNNILGAIQARSELLESKLEATPQLLRHVTAIKNAVETAAAFTRKLILFAKPGNRTPAVVDFGAAVSQMLQLLSLRFSNKTCQIRLHQELPVETLPVKAASGDIETLVMNLVENACDAMPHGGTLTISLRRINPHLVELVVADTGEGISAEHLPHVFEPFYTTKPAGRGTGLGLSISHAAVKQMGGQIEIQSEPGRGTTVRVTLPSCMNEPVKPQIHLPAKMQGRHVLLVDDEPGMLASFSEILQGLGCHVTPQNNPHQALEFFRGHPDKFDLVLADIRMPGLSGVELFRSIRELRPGQKVVLMSGFADENIPALLQDGLTAFLEKPCTREELETCLAHHLPPEPAR